MPHSFLLVLVSLALTACQSVPKRPHHNLELMPLSDYSMQGKMSFSDGKDGGTGRVMWRQTGQHIEARLKAPLSRQSWHIVETDAGAELTTAKGERWQDAEAEMLLSELVGWQVPWNALKAWVKGQASEPLNATVQNTEGGYQIQELGWLIEYSRIKAVGPGQLPHKFKATKGPYRIKLSVSQWEW